MNETKIVKIQQAFVNKNLQDYTMRHDIGSTFENYVKQQKTDAIHDAIEFTLKYLEENP